MYMVLFKCYEFDLTEMPLCFIGNLFFWLFCAVKWTKLGAFDNDTATQKSYIH